VLTLIANIVATISGFGLGTIMTPTLLLTLSFTQTILLVAILHWFHDLWKLYLYKDHVNWPILYYFGAASIITTFIGSLFVSDKFSHTLIPLLGSVLIAYVIFMVFNPTFYIRDNKLNSIIGGLLSGILGGLFGIYGAVRSAFLTAYILSSKQFIATTAAISLAINSTRLATYLARGIQLNGALTALLPMLILISFLGVGIGKYLVTKIPQKQFRSIVALLLLAISIRLILNPWL